MILGQDRVTLHDIDIDIYFGWVGTGGLVCRVPSSVFVPSQSSHMCTRLPLSCPRCPGSRVPKVELIP